MSTGFSGTVRRMGEDAFRQTQRSKTPEGKNPQLEPQALNPKPQALNPKPQTLKGVGFGSASVDLRCKGCRYSRVELS